MGFFIVEKLPVHAVVEWVFARSKLVFHSLLYSSSKHHSLLSELHSRYVARLARYKSNKASS